MKTVLINAKIGKNNKNEFFQAMESLKNLVRRYCKDFKINVSEDESVAINIVFENETELEKNFRNKEFNILKGSVRSLCDNVKIKIDKE